MKTALCINYLFPPLLWGWRSAMVAKYLSEFGWRSICLCAEPGHYFIDKSFDLEKLNGVEVHRIAHRPISRIRRYWRYARQKLKIGLDFPDVYQDWHQPAFWKACQILDQGKVDLIYNLSPTYTTARVALELKKKYGISWVVDFRDPWSANPMLESCCNKFLIQPFRSLQWRRIRKAEKEILTLADKIVYPTVVFRKVMQELYRSEAHKMEVLNNGYDGSTFQDLTPQKLYPDKLVITFLGSWYEPYSEPTKMFLDVLREIDRRIEVVFIGRAAHVVHQMNRANSTCILHLSREKSNAFALGSDFLFMVLPHPYQSWMASKLYTYLRTGRPILALVPEEGDAAQIIRQANAGFILSFDPIKLKTQLQDLFGRWRGGKFKNFQSDLRFVSQFEQKTVTCRLAEIFDQVLENKKTLELTT